MLHPFDPPHLHCSRHLRQRLHRTQRQSCLVHNQGMNNPDRLRDACHCRKDAEGPKCPSQQDFYSTEGTVMLLKLIYEDTTIS